MSLRIWRGMMTQRVSLAARSGQDMYGKPTYGTAVTYQARLVGKRRQVINAAGQQVVSDQTVYLLGAPAVGAQDRVTLSTADVGSTAALAITPPILSVARYPDERGQHHTVLYL
jgi:hypothetical protein